MLDPDHAEEHPPIAGFAADQALRGQAPGAAHLAEQPRERLPDRLGTTDRLLVDDHGGHQRDDADHRPDLDRHRVPVGADELVVVEAVGAVPDPLGGHGLADLGEMLEELEDQVERGTPAGAVQDRGDGGHGERVEAIQPVASDCSSLPPTGRWDRSIGPMLSSPRNPPSNRLEPSASSRFTHQVKFTSSLSNTRLRKSRSRAPSMANTSSAAQACTGG